MIRHKIGRILGSVAAAATVVLAGGGAAQADPPVPMVKLSFVATGHCATVIPNFDNSVWMQGCGTNSAQGWKIYMRYSPNVYEIRSDLDPGRCLDIIGGSTRPEAGIQTMPCVTTKTSQMWRTDVFASPMTLQNVKSTLCLGLPPGTSNAPLQISCSPAQNVLWRWGT